MVGTFSNNPESQITTCSRDNDGYAFTGYAAASKSYTANGQNQYATAGGASLTHDANGNLTGDGTNSYLYDVENRLVTSGAGAELRYDPLGRLWQSYSAALGTTRYLYDGDALVAAYDASGNMLNRYVHGDGTDQPLVWYQGSGTSAPKYLYSDERGSVVAIADGSGALTNINRYDEHGVPATGNIGRFQYTGQAWLPELGLFHYKARMYSPTLGRFMQTDPIGYDDGPNMYEYVGNDPVNRRDPSGTKGCPPMPAPNPDGGDVCVDGGGYRFNPYGGLVFMPGNRVAIPIESEIFSADVIVLAAKKSRSRATSRGGGGRTRKISRCMQGWLTDHYPGFDWSRPTVSSDQPLPGAIASTNSDLTVFVGGGKSFDNFEKNTSLFFHEVAHLPQWASGSLTTLGYIGSAIRHGGVHGNIPVEIEANAVRDFLTQAYKDEGKPCG